MFLVHILIIEAFATHFTKEPIFSRVAGEMVQMILLTNESFGTIFTLILQAFVSPHVLLIVATTVESLSTFLTVIAELSGVKLHMHFQTRAARILLVALAALNLSVIHSYSTIV